MAQRVGEIVRHLLLQTVVQHWWVWVDEQQSALSSRSGDSNTRPNRLSGMPETERATDRLGHRGVADQAVNSGSRRCHDVNSNGRDTASPGNEKKSRSAVIKVAPISMANAAW